MDKIVIQIDTNAAEAGKTFDQLNQKFKETDTGAKDLRKEIKELKAELFKLTPGTEEYAQALQQLGGKMNQLSDTTQELRVATGGLDTVFQTTTQATATMAGGFSAVMGVMTLFGEDTEDLQKTFVKLQAIMAITTGLKGFAAFAKMTKRASISLKAYISQVALATKATNQQTISTATLATTEGIATKATNLLSIGFKKLSAAIASNPIGLLLVAVTSAIAIVQRYNEKAKEAAEFTEEYNKAVGNTPPPVKTAQEQIDDYVKSLDTYDQKLKALGVSEERRTEIRREQLQEQIDMQEQERQKYKELVEEREKLLSVDPWTAIAIRIAQSFNSDVKSLDELQQAAIDASTSLGGLRAEMEKLTQLNLPSTFNQVNNELSALSDSFRISIAGGLATQGDYIQAQIDVYRNAIRSLYEGFGPNYHIKGEGTEEGKLNEELATTYRAQISKLEVDLKVYNAGLAKKANDAAKNAAATIEKNYDKLVAEINDKVDDYKDEWGKLLDKFKNLGELTSTLPDVLTSGQSLGRAFSEMTRYRIGLDEYLTEWLKLADKAQKTGELSEGKYKKFASFINETINELDDTLRGFAKVTFDDDSVYNISENMLNNVELIQMRAEKFKKDNDAFLEALSGGLVTEEEYRNFIIGRMKDYKNEIAELMPGAFNALETELLNVAPENRDKLREVLESYINISDDIIPPEIMDKITKVLTESIDKAFDKLEGEYEYRKNMFQSYWEGQNLSWLEGGKNTSYWGDSASTTFNKMQKQAEDLYNLLHEEYTQEAALLEEKMKMLDENSEAYKQYYQKLLELRDADMKAQMDYETASVANARQYAVNVVETVQTFTDSVGGLASAMGSYYAEQAEQAKEMYGENSVEYQKYLKKEGNMKIAQVWTDFATGVMTAWATSEQLGPIAGPILAAIQTAALLATAVASTQQIKRQTQASNNGGGSTANVGQLTDRVIYGDAQNANQQAELNGMYNQGYTRVYVTQGDIQDANNENRVAVTQNKF